MHDHILRRRPVDHFDNGRALDENPQGPGNTAMGHHHRWTFEHSGKFGQPRFHVPIILATFRAKVPIGLVACTRGNGHIGRQFLVEAAFENAKADFHQPHVELHIRQVLGKAQPHPLHGFARPSQWGCVPFKAEWIEPAHRKQGRKGLAVLAGLPPALVVERNVLAPLIAAFGVPGGFTMADEVDFRPDKTGHCISRSVPRVLMLESTPRLWHMQLRADKVAAHISIPLVGFVMSVHPSEIVSALSALVGSDNVVGDVSRMGAFLNEPRKRFHVPAAAVVTPPDVKAVQAIMAWAYANHVSIIPQGGNTGLVGAQVPARGDEVILSVVKLDRVRAIDTAAGVMVAEAGVILENAHKAADEAGAMFPLWLASQGSARIGGVLSSNAGGINVLAYGNARELTMGVEAVLADGRLYQGLNALKKDNTGYDLKDLLVGAEGTLGIITAASLKLYPRPEDYETALVNIASPDAALDLFQLMRQRAGSRLNAFELIPHIGLEIQLRHGMLNADPTASASPWYALIELSRMAGTEPGPLQAALEAAFEEALITDATIAESLAERSRMWAFREQMSECQSREGASIKHDVSVPIAAIPALIREGNAAAEKLVPGIRPVPFGHMGDGNIHFNFSMPIGANAKEFMALHDEAMHAAIYEVVLRHGGSVSAEHGIGQLKADLLRQVKDPVALEMMRAIKAALDPRGILNPGKMLG